MIHLLPKCTIRSSGSRVAEEQQIFLALPVHMAYRGVGDYPSKNIANDSCQILATSNMHY